MTEFKRVFVDTAPIIYYLENNAVYVEAIKDIFPSPAFLFCLDVKDICDKGNNIFPDAGHIRIISIF